MNLLFLIATCERPRKVRHLLDQILTQHPSATVLMTDDASRADYSDVRQIVHSTGGGYYRMSYRKGKREYWRVVNELFSRACHADFDYAFKLDDDIQLHPSAINQSVSLLDTITEYHSKAVLNMWVDHRAEQKIWTDQAPSIEYLGGEKLRRVGWVDGGNWAANRAAFEALDWSCPEPPSYWWNTAGDSSGVGKFLSIRMIKRACRIYMPMESLIFHGAHQSVMHSHKNGEHRPIEMKTKPWNEDILHRTT